MLQVPRRGGRKWAAPLNKGLSPSGDWGLDRQDFFQIITHYFLLYMGVSDIFS